MTTINILDEETIDKIAAGEVVERPLNVVKELTENAIDSGADAITVEIKDGGSSLIRVTDNGCGVNKSQVKKAFLRHATSKIVKAEDLIKISSLGFRGEALSSIAAVSSVEMISKERDSLLGFRYHIEGSKEIELNDIGAPDGTTVIVKDLFYNVPARKKFLKSNQTEGAYVSDMMEHLALSHPEISIKFIINNKTLFQTSGNGNLKEVIYRIYGKEISEKLISLNVDNELFKVTGFLGKPEINRSNRNFENYFVNGRYVHCDVINKAVEEGYKNFLMQHKFPFVILSFSLDPQTLDVNVHPQKMDIKLSDGEKIYPVLVDAVKDALANISLIPSVVLEETKEEKISIKAPEPFESNRIKLLDKEPNVAKTRVEAVPENAAVPEDMDIPEDKPVLNDTRFLLGKEHKQPSPVVKEAEQLSFIDDFLANEAKDEYEILGQIFKTYWLIGFKDKLYIMDQHAAHEKVKYERLLLKLKNKSVTSQMISPPCIVTLTPKEEVIIKENVEYFRSLGFEIEDFGLGSIAIRSFPSDLYGCNEFDFFREILDELIDNPLRGNHEVILNKLASMACKAAVKGNTLMSVAEVKALLDELMTLDNPYNCPHGRPTIISMTKYEIDKKFKRVVG